jgi:hypothetical protein
VTTRVRHIFQTVTEDADTGRIRSIRPGEQVETFADMLDKNTDAMSDGAGAVPGTQEADDMFGLRYITEADEVEDAILFPTSANDDIPNRTHRYKTAVEKFQMGKLRMWKIGYDLSTDEESSGSDSASASASASESESESDGDQAMVQTDARLETALNFKRVPFRGKRGDSHKRSFERDQKVLDQRAGPFIPQFEWVAQTQDLYYFLPILRDPACARVIPTELRTRSVLMHTLRTALHRQRDYTLSNLSSKDMLQRHSQRSNAKGTFTVSCNDIK